MQRVLVCEYTLNGLPKPACVTNQCSDCKADSIQTLKCPLEEETHRDKKVIMKEMMKEERTVTTKAGDTTRKYTCERVVHSIEFHRLKKRLLDVMTRAKPMKFTGFEQAVPFLEHRWVSHVQARGFRNQITKFGKSHLIIVADFGSNASFRATQQTQGGFFTPAQATFCPLILCYWDEVNGNFDRWAHAYDVISEDLKHDAAFVQTIMRDAVEWAKCKLRERGCELKCVHVWTDGCREQFKNKDVFAFVSSLHMTLSVLGEWCFFCSCHGKGGSDAETSILHRLVRSIQNEVGRIDSAKAAYELMDARIEKETFKSKKIEDKKTNSLAERFLVWYSGNQTQREKAVTASKGIAGSNNHHRFGNASGKAGELDVTYVACPHACEACMELRYDDCRFKATTNYRSGAKRLHGQQEESYKVKMDVKIPRCFRPAPAAPASDSDASEAKSDHEEPARPLAMRSRRPRHAHVRRLKKGFTFCVRAALQNPDQEMGPIWYCEVQDYLQHASMVMYKCYVEVDKQPGVWVLHGDTYTCSVGEMLPPFGWHLTMHDEALGQYVVNERLQAKFSETVANLR
jgi:hypothetical protein